jgi:Winged helix-turn-helix domain (DUF2582)
MAKKKSASSDTSTSNKSSSVATKKIASKSSSNGDASTAAGILGAEQIGMTAGSVWLYLTDNGPTSLTALKKAIDEPSDLILAAVGWLAREEKIEFTVSGKTVTLALKQE